MEEPQLHHDPDTPFNVLDFWKENEVRLGKLSHLARDILTVPLTIIASESTFSIGGRMYFLYVIFLYSYLLEA